MSSKFSFIIPEKNTAKGRSMSQKECEAKKNFIVKWTFEFLGLFHDEAADEMFWKPVAMGYLASCRTSNLFLWTSKNEVVTCPTWQVAKNVKVKPCSRPKTLFTFINFVARAFKVVFANERIATKWKCFKLVSLLILLRYYVVTVVQYLCIQHYWA